MKNRNQKNITYAVFGPGWGKDYLGAPGSAPGSGDIAFVGHSLVSAKSELEKCKKTIAGMRTRPGMRDVNDTYAIYATSDEYHGWVPLERFVA